MIRKLLLLLIILLLSSCAISHKYGPYKGKVVDKDTGEPIQGAVVFLRFYTEFGFSPGGAVYKFADAVETMTDENGEYYLPSIRVNTFRVGSSWDKKPLTIIFKPSYGVYPRHPDTSDGRSPKGWLGAREKDLIKLPRLKTRQERLYNLRSFENYESKEISCEKQRYIIKSINTENIYLGLKPGKMKECGDILN